MRARHGYEVADLQKPLGLRFQRVQHVRDRRAIERDRVHTSAYEGRWLEVDPEYGGMSQFELQRVTNLLVIDSLHDGIDQQCPIPASPNRAPDTACAATSRHRV